MTENGKPKYFSLMEQLKADIVSGAICPGEKLPSENELAALNPHIVVKVPCIADGIKAIKHFTEKGHSALRI